MSETLFEDLKTYILTNREKESFPVMLNRLREEKGIKEPELYKRADVTRGYYWKMMEQRHPNISKKIAVAYGIALELDRETMDALLRSAGYALSNNSGFDLVVMCCIERRFYDYPKIVNVAKMVCNALNIPLRGEEVFAGKPAVDIDIEKFDTTGDAGNADPGNGEQETDSDFQCDNFTDLLEKITERLDDFTEKLGDGADCLDEDQSAEDDMSEDEAAVYQKVQRVAEPLVSLLNSMAEKLERATFEIINK
jgi:hypothetical protein